MFCICHGAGPGVMVVNKRDVLECVVDTSRIEETGAFIWILSNGLETGCREKYAGLAGMDYKIEDGTLSRYTGQADNPWRTMANLKRQSLGSWQAYALPKSMFLKPEGRVEWRVIFFPRQSEALLMPAGGVGNLELGKFADVAPSRPGDLCVEYFTGMSGNAQMAAAGNEMDAGMRLNLDLPAHRPAAQMDRTSFNLPAPGCLVWPDTAGADPLANDCALGHRLGGKCDSILFGPLDLPAGPKAALLRARLQACRLSGRGAYFHVQGPGDMPTQATGVVFRHGADLKSDILAMQKLREKFKGPMWVQIDDSFWKLGTGDRNLVVKAWLLFEFLPLLPPDQVVEGISHRQTVFFIWHMLHVEYMMRGGRKLEDHLPLPTDVNTTRVMRRRQMSLDAYLVELRAGLEKAFLAAVRDGS